MVDALRTAMESPADDVSLRWQRNRDEIDAKLEEARKALQAVIGESGSAAFEPWLSTNEGEERRVVLRKKDGYDVGTFSVSIPLEGYPVTLRIRERVYRARTADELDDLLANTVLTDPDVIAAVKYVTGA